MLKDGRLTLLYNPAFLDPRTMKDTKAILEHECLHVVMEHFIRFKNANHEYAKIAADVAINQLLPHIPEDALTVQNVFHANNINAEREREAEYYYNLIAKEVEKLKQSMGKGCGNDFNQDVGSGLDAELQKEIIKQMVSEAVNTARKSGQGQLPAGIEDYLEELFSVPLPTWRQLLKKFVANTVKCGTKASWKKPSRRYGDQQKGRIADRTANLVIGLDTSGSTFCKEVQDIFMANMKVIVSCYKTDMTVIECDAKVQKVYKLNKWQPVDRKIKGGGGTKFTPVFNHIRDKHLKCDGVIFFTDLLGEFPDKKPPYPVLWAHYNEYGNTGHAPFGKVIELKKD
jgi:predicted metal-dependent peptidase